MRRLTCTRTNLPFKQIVLSSPRISWGCWLIVREYPEQHEHSATAALRRPCLAERQHILPLREPAANPGFQDGLPILRSEPLAVYHSHAALAAFAACIHERHQREPCFLPRKPVQVKLGLYFPIASPQPTQGLARDAGAQKNPFITGLHGADIIRQPVMGNRSCRLKLKGDGWRMAGRKNDLIGWGEGRDVTHGVTKQGSIIIPDGCGGSLSFIALGSSFCPRDGMDARLSFPPSHLDPRATPFGQFPSGHG